MPGPLTGLTVLDLTRILAGPFCTMVLRDLGAEVIKIERPEGGDTARGNGPFVHGLSSYFLSVNRGKKSVTLNLATVEGRGLLQELAKQADVVVENFVPGTMGRFGLGYHALKEKNPALVYCSISGFGQTGPYAPRPALDVVVQGMGGIMSVTGEPGGPPIRPGASIGDIAAGLYSAIGILAALFERSVTGLGQQVDIAMLDCQVAIQENAFSRYFATGEVPGPLGTRHPVFTPFQAFQTSDSWIVIAMVGGFGDQWPLFCATIGRLDLIDVPEYADGGLRTQHYSSLEPLLSEALSKRTTAEWLQLLGEAGIPCGPVNTIDKVAADPQVAAREMFVEVSVGGKGAVKLINSPVKLSRTPGVVDSLSPELGEHTAEVLAQRLGLNAAQVKALRAEGVV
ncbi:MAG: CoA transferase [Dehalococcoidia bacterium]|nr:CoA transferase [Dehalococcoidia bacterium]